MKNTCLGHWKKYISTGTVVELTHWYRTQYSMPDLLALAFKKGLLIKTTFPHHSPCYLHRCTNPFLSKDITA